MGLFLLSSAVHAMKALKAPNEPLELDALVAETKSEPNKWLKGAGALGGLAALIAGTSGAMSLVREDKNDNEAVTDLISAEALPEDFGKIEVSKLGEYTYDGKDLTKFTGTNTDAAEAADGKPFDGTIFYQAGSDVDADNAGNLAEAFLQADLHYEVVGLDAHDVDLGEFDFLIARDIDATSVGVTFAMIGMISIGAIFLAWWIFAFGPGKQLDLLSSAILPAIGVGLGFSTLLGLSFHFMSAQNTGAMLGCGVGALLVLIIAAVAYGILSDGLNKNGGILALKSVGHVLGGTALLAGCAMLTNLAGEAIGERGIDTAVHNVFSMGNAAVESGGMGSFAFLGCGLLAVGLFWILKTLIAITHPDGAKQFDLMNGSSLVEKVILFGGAGGAATLMTVGFEGLASETTELAAGGFVGAAVLIGVLFAFFRFNLHGKILERCFPPK
jgi:hypothetical protein